jgi:hypothetical protein
MFLNRGMLIAAYSIAVLFGLCTVLFPVTAILTLIGLHWTYFYGLLILVGAVGSLIAVIRTNYKVEYIFLWLVTGGFLCYDIALWGLFADRLGVLDGLAPPYGPALAMAVLVLMLTGKLMKLAQGNRRLVVGASDAGLD